MIRSLIAILIAAVLSGCAAPARGPYETPSASSRSPLTAERFTQQAAAIMDSDPEQAEALLRKALSADLYHGPAHNNLGVIYLKRGDLYEAANEFEWARKLMPGHPDPRLNLAMTLERAGRIDDALGMYATALEVYPDHIPSIQGLVRCQLRHGRADERTDRYLGEVAMRGETVAWREWARGRTIG